MVSKQAAEWQIQSELREQMQGYKRMRQQHKAQVGWTFLKLYSIIYILKCTQYKLSHTVHVENECTKHVWWSMVILEFVFSVHYCNSTCKVVRVHMLHVFYPLLLVTQMQQLESKHKSDLAAHFKSQEKEVEQLWAIYERDLEKLRSRHKTENDQKVSTVLAIRSLAVVTLYIHCTTKHTSVAC